MTDQLRQTAQQALEALEWISALQTGGMIQVRATEPQAGLRMALEQQAEPVFDCPQKTPLTHEQRLDVLTAFEKHKAAWNAPSILIDLVEAAHNIK